MEGKILHSIEFDIFGADKSSIDIVQGGTHDADATLLIRADDKEIPLFQTYRDQWGTWIAVSKEITIGQEDETRSFVDALIKSLEKLKAFTDCETKEPTITVDNFKDLV